MVKGRSILRLAPAGGFGGVVPPGQAQGSDGEVPEGGHGSWPGAGADGGVAFAVEGVAPVQGLDRPLAAGREAMAWGLARVASRLVTPGAAMPGSGVPCRAVTCRSIRYAWLTCGNGRSPGAFMTWMVRVSIRPWPRPVAAWATGTPRQGRASRASNRPG